MFFLVSYPHSLHKHTHFIEVFGSCYRTIIIIKIIIEAFRYPNIYQLRILLADHTLAPVDRLKMLRFYICLKMCKTTFIKVRTPGLPGLSRECINHYAANSVEKGRIQKKISIAEKVYKEADENIRSGG